MLYNPTNDESSGMTEEEIRYSIETNEVKLTFREKLNHYGIVGLQLIIEGLYLNGFVRDHLNKILTSTDELVIGVFIVLLLLTFLTYKLQKRRLAFKSIETGLKKSELNDIIRKVGLEHKWILLSVNENSIVAKTTPGYFPVSGRERITILFDQNKVFINSICDPLKTSRLLSLGQNKRNENRLLDVIRRGIIKYDYPQRFPII